MNTKEPMIETYSQVASIGAGFSAIGLGASLYRWYGISDIQFFERRASSGGTWFANNYPGCACDVPSALYSYSFEQNPNWTKLLPGHSELKSYLDGVAAKYNLLERMRFHTEVEGYSWDEDRSRWRLLVKDVRTGQKMIHVCQVLFNCGGALVNPNPIAFPGQETFKGDIFHSALWDHAVDMRGKRVVVIGNGCTGAQIVPALVREGEVASLTNIIRSKQWIYPSMDFQYSNFMKWCFKHVPFALQLHRFHIFLYAEQELPTFEMSDKGNRLREQRRKYVEGYMRSAAPAEYHDLLIPEFEIGCKRRIYDSGYLAALHDPRVSLTNSPIREFVPEGVRTDDGIIKADIIVVANGFNVHRPLPQGLIKGRNGEDLAVHWSKYGGPGAYNGSAVASFPNLFLILGPNSGTGHTSAIMSLENQINQAMRVLKPVFEGKEETVEISQEAETDFVLKCQAALRKLVWHKGACSNWFENSKGWNTALYPWTPFNFWMRCLFPVWGHWLYGSAKHDGLIVRRSYLGASMAVSALIGLFGAVVYFKGAKFGPQLVSFLQAWWGLGRRLGMTNN